jgi:3-hydroxyisobutyrate dehydrogenase
LLAAGAKTAQTPAALAAAADIVILCVTGTPEVEDVLLREDGLLHGLKPGAIVIDCSTAMPSSTIRLAAQVEKAGGRLLDAAMTRTPKEAAEGRLNLIVGADPALFETCKPLLECFAENIVLAGPVGSGHKLKLLHNFVSLGFSAVLAEAAACADRCGIAPDIFVEALASGGGAGVILNRLRPYIEARDDSAFRFFISNAGKDMGYYTAMAEELGAMHLTADAVLQAYEFAGKAGGAQATVPELITLLAGGR